MSNDRQPTEPRQQRIRQLVDDCVQRWAAGEPVDEIEIIDAHPDLHPELEQQLQKLRVVGRAAALAENPHAAETIESPPLEDGLRVRCPHCRNAMEIVEHDTVDVQCLSCGSEIRFADEDQDGSAEPRRFGNFRLESLLGTGAFGAVWRAHDEELDRDVAIKIPRRSQLEPSHTEQFFREARISAQLDHPNIVRVHEIGKEGDTVYIVSDLVQGEPLSQWMIGRTMTIRETVTLCATLASAVHHAHTVGVIHRDLKPANVMMDRNGEPRIMDFGLAKREVGEITMTADGQVLGTPAYMSPEQASGDSHRVDGRSDVYSLGVMLFELLTGELPFRGSVRMLIEQVIHDEPPSPRRLAGSIPRDLETICLKCLHKERGSRYASAKLMADDLHRFLRGEPVQARPVSRVDRAWRWSKRNPMATAVIALVAFLAIAGPAFALHERRLRKDNETLTGEKFGFLQQLSDSRAPTVDEIETIKNLSMVKDISAERWIAIAMAKHYASTFPPDGELPPTATLGIGMILAAAPHPNAQHYLRQGVNQLEAMDPEQRTPRQHMALVDGYLRLSETLRRSAPKEAFRLAEEATALAKDVDFEDEYALLVEMLRFRSRLSRALALVALERHKEGLMVWMTLGQNQERLPKVLPRQPEDIYRLAHWLLAKHAPILIMPSE